MAVLHLQFDRAFAYHPLYWTVPLVLLLAIARNRFPKKMLTALMSVIIIAFIVVWVVRLITPHEANVLCSKLLDEDVVSVDTPEWVMFFRSLFDKR